MWETFTAREKVSQERSTLLLEIFLPLLIALLKVTAVLGFYFHSTINVSYILPGPTRLLQEPRHWLPGANLPYIPSETLWHLKNVPRVCGINYKSLLTLVLTRISPIISCDGLIKFQVTSCSCCSLSAPTMTLVVPVWQYTWNWEKEERRSGCFKQLQALDKAPSVILQWQMHRTTKESCHQNWHQPQF